MHISPTTLEEVGHLFSHWRTHKTGRPRIPDELWNAAIALTEQYSVSEITKYLNVNPTQFRQELTLRKSPQMTDFANITPLLNQAEALTLEFTRRDGASVKCQCPSQRQLQDTLAWFLAC